MNAPIIDSRLKAQRTNLNKLDRLPPGRISGHSKEFALIVPNVSISLVYLVALVYLVSLVY